MSEQVVLVDEQDRELGTREKLAAHRGAGVLHRAFSVFLFDARGRTLLQQRAADKYHFGGLWANSCCGHPRPGEALVPAAQRRLREEMGIAAALETVTRFIYSAQCARSGLTEHELDHVLVGRFEGTPAPDPAEATAWRWAAPEQLEAELARTPANFTPWLPLAWAALQRARR